MAFTRYHQHYIGTGDDTNGGSFDSTLGGVNYADQDSPSVSVTDGVAIGTTRITSAAGTFTPEMIGSQMYIATKSRRVMTAYTDAHTIDVDANVASGTGLTMKLGGRLASPRPLCTTCLAGAPPVTSPLLAGHRIYVTGPGTDTPGSATYSWSTGYTFPAGGQNGLIKWYSTTGKVRLDLNKAFAAINGHVWRDFYWHTTGNNSDNVTIYTSTDGSGVNSWLERCVIDQNGYATGGTNVVNCIDCGFINSGEGSAVSAVCSSAISGTAGEPAGTNTGRIMGCSIINWKTPIGNAAIEHPNWCTIEENLLYGCTGIGMKNGTANSNSSFINNIVHSCGSYGAILYHDYSVDLAYLIRNNLFISNGNYGLANIPNAFEGGDSHDPLLFVNEPDYNFYYGNTNGPITGWVQGAHDGLLTGDPFVNAAGLDFRLNQIPGAGRSVIGRGWPRSYYGTNT